MKENTINKKKLLITLVLIVLALVSFKLLYNQYLLNKATPLSYDSRSVNWENSSGEVAGKTNYIIIPNFDTVSLEAGSDLAKITLANPSDNTCNFQFQLILEDDSETIYLSKMVAPGKAIVEETLSRPLKAGDYDLIIRINTFSEDGKISSNKAELKTILHVTEM